MNRNARQLRSTGFTLVEISIALGVLMIVGAIAYSVLISSTTLLAKNVSLNSSNAILRGALDRMFSEINQANGLRNIDPVAPKLPCLLINADGTAASGTGPAAGIIFDRYLGGPYIVGNPGTGLPATTTSIKLLYSTDPMAHPPQPALNDVVMIGSTRASVSSCVISLPPGPGPAPILVPNPGEVATVTLQNPLGRSISWSSSVDQIAYLVHRRAFVVVPVNGVGGPPAELRMYSNAETVTTNFNNPANYTVLTREIGTKTISGLAEHMPFSIETQTGANFLKIAMRVEDQQFNKYLAARQSPEFNTFLRVDAKLRPRNYPQ